MPQDFPTHRPLMWISYVKCHGNLPPIPSLVASINQFVTHTISPLQTPRSVLAPGTDGCVGQTHLQGNRPMHRVLISSPDSILAVCIHSTTLEQEWADSQLLFHRMYKIVSSVFIQPIASRLAERRNSVNIYHDIPEFINT